MVSKKGGGSFQINIEADLKALGVVRLLNKTGKEVKLVRSKFRKDIPHQYRSLSDQSPWSEAKKRISHLLMDASVMFQPDMLHVIKARYIKR